MAIGYKSGHSWYEIGNADYLHSFYSTLCYYLEDKKWGSKYPYLMKELYDGKLPAKNAKKALREIKKVKEKTSKMEKDKYPIIWEIEDLSKKAPKWAVNPNEKVLNLYEYYVNNSGYNLIDVTIEAIEDSIRNKNDLIICKI